MKIAGYETHPAAELFPILEGQELDDLASDIKRHGLLQPVVLHEGKILDGRNRALACQRAGVALRTDDWRGKGSPAAWVVSQNLHRRHLTASQRAMVGAALVPMFEEEAKARIVAGGRAGGLGKGPANLPEASRGEAREKAAEAVSVSPRSVADAVTVTEQAPPEVVEAVKQGKVAVSAAAKKTREGKPGRSKPKKEGRDWKCSLTLVVPHSALASVIRALRKMGFEGGGGSSRKMRLKKLANLHVT